MKQSEINGIMKICREAADPLTCEEALYAAGYAGKTKKLGTSLFFECPNGCDRNKKLDKCAINLDKNFAHCFCCNEGWNPVKLMASLWEVPYNQAVLTYGKSVGAITGEQYSAIADDKGNFAKAMKGTVAVKKAEQRAIEEAEFKRPAEHLDLVYRHLLALPACQLSASHAEYLKKERRLTAGDIAEIGFFSYEQKFSMAALTASIQKEQPGFNPREHYWGVPGFFFQFSDENKTRGHWLFHKPYMDCIGIPIRDEAGRITALQMRALSDRAQVKYFFVTSKRCGDNTGFGSTPSTPCSVLYPKEITNPYVYIGEGIFKMFEVAKGEQSVAISVQGVNNTKDVPDMIREVLLSDMAKRKAPALNGKHTRMQVIIVYDADMYRNYRVLEASQNLVKGLKKAFPDVPASFLCWDLNLGKGFDDLKHYADEQGLNYHHLCRTVPAETFLALSNHCINKAAGGKKTKKMLMSPEFPEKLYQEIWVKNLSQFF